MGSYSHLRGSICQIQEELETKWRFQCKCLLCGMKNVNTQKEIETYRLKYWKQWEKTGKPVDGLQRGLLQRLGEIDLLFEYMEKGRLLHPAEIAGRCYDGFKIASACKRLHKKQWYIKQAYKFNLIAEGKYSPTTKKFFELMKYRLDDRIPRRKKI